MIEYRIIFKKQALDDAKELKAHEPRAYKRLEMLIEELRKHPRTGTGRPEQLKGEPHGRWSRCITLRHRLVYEIHDHDVVGVVLAPYGHYNDK